MTASEVRNPARHLAVYRSLVRLYPQDFREEYGECLVQHFKDQITLTHDRRTWQIWAGTLADFVSSAVQQKGSSMRGSKGVIILSLFVAAAATAMVVGVGSRMSALLFGLGTLAVLFGLVAVITAVGRRSSRSTEFAYGSPSKRPWWMVPALLTATFNIVMGAGLALSEPKIENFIALVVLASAGAIGLMGLRLRLAGRLSGNWLVAMAAIPACVWFWMVVPPILGILVLAGALSELAGAKPVPI